MEDLRNCVVYNCQKYFKCILWIYATIFLHFATYFATYIHLEIMEIITDE